MNRFCNKCTNQIKLIQKDDNLFGCPKCHSQYEVDENNSIRIAQFGGNIAKPNIQGPGSSPLFKGLSNRNKGTNTRFETSIENIMSRTHRPAPIDPERNIEKRLEQFHNHAEEDSIPYELDSKQRARLKVRKEIRRREKFYEDAATRVEKNSVDYIKKHFQNNNIQPQSLEESLSSKRKYEKLKEKSITEDESPDQIKPDRRHTVANARSTVFDDKLISDDDAEMNYNKKFLTVGPFLDVFGGILDSNSKLEDYLKAENYDLSLWLNDTVNLDYPDLDENASSNYIAVNNPSLVVFDFDPGDTSIEEGLSELMQVDSDNPLPKITSPGDINRDKQVGEGKEPRSVFQQYPYYPGEKSTPPLPK
jgi:hypothetical protein